MVNRAMTIKAQLLDDFLVENSFFEDESLAIIPYEEKDIKHNSQSWIMIVDGAVDIRSAGLE